MFPWMLNPMMMQGGASSPPSAPTGLVAVGLATQIILSGYASAGATSFKIYRGTTPGGESGTPIATGVTTTTYSDTGLTPGTYYYTLKATGPGGDSVLFSNEATATAIPATGLAPALPNVAYMRSAGLLFQNTGKTLLATANGEPVRVATDPISGIDYVAPSNSARPILTDDTGGKWSFTFDGIDDCMLCAQSAATDLVADTNTVGFSSAWSGAAVGASQYMACRGSTGNASICWGAHSTNNYPTSGSNAQLFFVPTSGTHETTPRTTVFRRAGTGTDNVRKDGSSIAGTPLGATVTASGAVGITIGAFNSSGTPSLFAPYKLWGFLPYGGQNYATTNLAAIEAYLTSIRP